MGVHKFPNKSPALREQAFKLQLKVQKQNVSKETFLLYPETTVQSNMEGG